MLSLIQLNPEALPCFLKLLRQLDPLYRPRLSEKTVLEDFARKVLSEGIVLAAEHDSGLVGCICFYANDTRTGTAYISLVGVIPVAAGKHVATRLVAAAVEHVRKTGMKRIGIHTNNPAAGHIYGKAGFRTVGVENQPESGLTRYYMEYEF